MYCTSCTMYNVCTEYKCTCHGGVRRAIDPGQTRTMCSTCESDNLSANYMYMCTCICTCTRQVAPSQLQKHQCNTTLTQIPRHPFSDKSHSHNTLCSRQVLSCTCVGHCVVLCCFVLILYTRTCTMYIHKCTCTCTLYM